MRIGTMFGRFNLRKGHRFRMGKDPFGDKDKDGVMNVVDCKPNDSRRQGMLQDLTTKYRGWKAKAPERERARIGRETARATLTEEREQRKISSLKRYAEMERQKTAIVKTQAERRRYAASGFNRGIEAGSFGLGRSGLMPGLSSSYSKAPKPVVKHKHHRKHKHKSSTGKRYTIIGGKAYQTG